MFLRYKRSRNKILQEISVLLHPKLPFYLIIAFHFQISNSQANLHEVELLSRQIIMAPNIPAFITRAVLSAVSCISLCFCFKSEVDRMGAPAYTGADYVHERMQQQDQAMNDAWARAEQPYVVPSISGRGATPHSVSSSSLTIPPPMPGGNLRLEDLMMNENYRRMRHYDIPAIPMVGTVIRAPVVGSGTAIYHARDEMNMNRLAAISEVVSDESYYTARSHLSSTSSNISGGDLDRIIC